MVHKEWAGRPMHRSRATIYNHSQVIAGCWCTGISTWVFKTGMERYHGSMGRSSWLVQRSVRAIGQVALAWFVMVVILVVFG